jgi:hypothetical protein
VELECFGTGVRELTFDRAFFGMSWKSVFFVMSRFLGFGSDRHRIDRAFLAAASSQTPQVEALVIDPARPCDALRIAGMPLPDIRWRSHRSNGKHHYPPSSEPVLCFQDSGIPSEKLSIFAKTRGNLRQKRRQFCRRICQGDRNLSGMDIQPSCEGLIAVHH